MSHEWSLAELAMYVDNNGIASAILNVHVSKIIDPTLQDMWAKAQNQLEDISSYLSKGIVKPAEVTESS